MIIRQHSPAFFAFVICILSGACKPRESKSHNTNEWYKNQLIYNLDVDAFKDSDGDGTGDFKGLISKLDYLKSIGVDIIWLAPFQPTPDKDDGYDIADYYGIDKRLGTKADYRLFMTEAKKRGLRVVMDIVLNHTSIEHPWFTQSRSDTSRFRNWYVWSDKRPKDWDKGMGFPKVETETWTKDSLSGRYYFHRFYTFQPDLNFEEPAVVKESIKVLKYWLDEGMDGFRLDAVPFIIDLPKTSSDHPEVNYKVLDELTGFVHNYRPNAILLGEANVEPGKNQLYFGENGSRLTMMFNFYANQYLFYGLASGNIKPFKNALIATSEKPGKSQWAYFLRNHDEIDLGRLSKSDRKLIYDKFGPDTTMQLYDRGIRRRLAPMLSNNPRQLRMAYSLLFSLPGTPVIRYGEELGMGDDMNLKERLAVRTPMQWQNSTSAGFSDAAHTFRPVISAGEYAYPGLNVQEEINDTASLLNFIKQMIFLRRQCPEIGYGQWKILDTGSDQVLGLLYTENDKKLMIFHNFSPVSLRVTLSDDMGKENEFLNLLTGTHDHLSKKFNIPAYGFNWYRLNKN
jgi:maltose alpha-D-glucosyltransferase/alpha-amylase